MENELVSVIMPAFNSALYISKTIESVISQTYKNWELIIVDDGSTDDTKLIVSNFTKNYSNIHYYYQLNGKQGKARNTGIKYSRGTYVAFLDSDDLWLPEKLEKSLKIMQETGCEVVSTNAWVVLPPKSRYQK
jgi:teichuronic acid biosynthesis glycosyltransferase TuaG